MTRWKKDETNFTVSLSNDGKNSRSCRMPKPLLEQMNYPDKITFVLRKNRIEVVVND